MDSLACAIHTYKILACSLLNSLDLDENTKAVLVENIQRKLTQQAVKIRADFECSCFTYEGIDAVKHALKEGLSLSTPDIPIKINLIAAPLYGQLFTWTMVNVSHTQTHNLFA